MASQPRDPQDIEWLDLGPPDRDAAGAPRRRPRPLRRSLIIGVAAVALVIAIGVGTAAVLTGHHARHHVAASTAPTGSTPVPFTSDNAGAEVTATAAPRSGPPQVTTVGHRLLGVTDGWNLFLRGDNDIVRVQLAAGRVTVTPAPTLGSGGGVSFLVTRSRAFVLPSDFVPGFMVADGAAAADLPGNLSTGGNVYPGPVDGEFWQQVASADTTSAFELLDSAGRDLHRAITIPQTMPGPATADGSGYLIVQGVSGSYEARPGLLRRITTGQVTAVGPTEWLVEECDDVGQCSNVVVDKVTLQRQVVGPTVSPGALAMGAVSPNGSLAAVIRPSPQRRFAVNLIELATGAEHTVLDISDGVFSDQMMAWSPDGKWLFVIGEAGAVQIINSATLQHVSLGVQLPVSMQLTVRPAQPR
ncbi:MAG TPA: hypothetical protein VGN35_05430 [Jatrophihabitantaceae bacterium]|jgi:hypothetical protein|nr:hypothetical protein [Jatrophihabitantaceae bacterium]